LDTPSYHRVSDLFHHLREAHSATYYVSDHPVPPLIKTVNYMTGTFPWGGARTRAKWMYLYKANNMICD